MKKLLSSVNSWKEFKSSLHTLSNKEKGDAFELLTKYYLQLDPTYKSLISNVWIHHEVPNPIRKKLNLPPQDMGIDIIAETKSGEYWAVQCKYRDDESNALTWKEVSTFIGLANTKCKHISHCIIATSKDRLVKVLDDVNLGLLAGDTWRNLDQEFFSKLHLVVKSKSVRIKPLKPYSHKKRAIKNAYKHFITNKQNRGKLIMPCGTGKTLTAFWIAEKLGAKTIVIAVPSLSLIRQTLKVWLREVVAKNIDAEWICVCSDQKAGTWKRDELQYLNQDLGVPALTDPEYIAKWLRKRRKGLSVVFTTYQSGKVLSQAAKAAKRVFDLGIMDEAHKTVGSKDKKFAHLLFDENIKIKKRCFMTATERRYLGTKDDIISMDDMDIYGETFELLSFKEAIEQSPPILTDYKIITIGVGRDHIEDLIRKNVFVKPDKGKWNKKMEAEMLASLIALRKAMRGRNIKHALSFHSSIAKAKVFADNQENFTKVFPEYWNVDAFHVSGKMNTSERDRIIKDEFIESKRAIMTNARCLTEGVDVPAIDCVLFADPKKSTIDIVQAVGRALRLAKGKKFGYVIVPVIIEKEMDFKKSDAYQSILMVLRALASNDDRIIDYFRATTNKERKGLPVEIEVDEKLAKLIDTKEFIKTIELNVWNRLAKLSWMPFEEARAFVHDLKLKSTEEWILYAKSDKKPADIPRAPNIVYNNSGWKGHVDWLGGGRRIGNWRDFKKARQFARKLNFKIMKEWALYAKSDKKPNDIPADPGKVYKNIGWISNGDWLGTGRIADKYKVWLEFTKARLFVRKLKLKNESEWRKYTKSGKKPSNIPVNPGQVYKDTGWSGMGDWLGTGYIHHQLRKFTTFKKARLFVRNLKLKNQKEWFEYSKSGNKPVHIPGAPQKKYKNEGWKNWGDFLGTGRISDNLRVYKNFSDARRFARSLKLNSYNDWKKYINGMLSNKKPLPPDIPKHPNSATTYKKDWKGWKDFLKNKSDKTKFGERNHKRYENA
ncbi:hypothetical protein EB821_01045 [Candidatus Marinimicrobia bacterium PRS2]|nr:hypothetical protein EB821_01045 [Candidatus Marinimicrobia bacterium PRS2]